MSKLILVMIINYCISQCPGFTLSWILAIFCKKKKKKSFFPAQCPGFSGFWNLNYLKFFIKKII